MKFFKSENTSFPCQLLVNTCTPPKKIIMDLVIVTAITGTLGLMLYLGRLVLPNDTPLSLQDSSCFFTEQAALAMGIFLATVIVGLVFMAVYDNCNPRLKKYLDDNSSNNQNSRVPIADEYQVIFPPGFPQ